MTDKLESEKQFDRDDERKRLKKLTDEEFNDLCQERKKFFQDSKLSSLNLLNEHMKYRIKEKKKLLKKLTANEIELIVKLASMNKEEKLTNEEELLKEKLIPILWMEEVSDLFDDDKSYTTFGWEEYLIARIDKIFYK